ncbi:hypothetical protein J7K05_00295 [bacterium]|nr:hypothetical protein [bacterium]
MAKKRKISRKKKARVLSPLVSWRAALPDRGWSYHSLWFFLVLAVAAVFVFGLHNILAAVVLGLMALYYLWLSLRVSDIYKVEVTKKGIVYNRHFYSFGDILFYSIEKAGKDKVLVIRTVSRVLPEITILLPKNKSEKVDKVLSRYLPKKPIVSVLGLFLS